MEPASGKGGVPLLITRETDYALRILRALSQGVCLTVGEIAEKESLPHKFTYKIMKKLEKAGIIRIIREIGRAHV